MIDDGHHKHHHHYYQLQDMPKKPVPSQQTVCPELSSCLENPLKFKMQSFYAGGPPTVPSNVKDQGL